MGDEKQRVAEMLEPLIQEAERTGMWLYHNGLATGELWFSPAELRAANKEGRFLWGPVNWKLLPPSVKLSSLEKNMQRLHNEWDKTRERMGQ